jgi:hypothetical protein
MRLRPLKIRNIIFYNHYRKVIVPYYNFQMIINEDARRNDKTLIVDITSYRTTFKFNGY